MYEADPSRPAGSDETDSADLALRLLEEPGLGVDAAVGGEVARLVRLTADHRTAPGDAAGAALCDADLEVLGRAPRDYDRYVSDVRADFAHVGEEQWRVGRAAVLERLLEAEHLYATATGRARWEAAARSNLRRELDSLR